MSSLASSLAFSCMPVSTPNNNIISTHTHMYVIEDRRTLTEIITVKAPHNNQLVPIFHQIRYRPIKRLFSTLIRTACAEIHSGITGLQISIAFDLVDTFAIISTVVMRIA